ncbi:hypothetical protein H2248_003371 [Termitomyces sp. 'cryptogamus']|nr:hypothetical protein H2248_003371 [Termitomyces sp. 'cryptogamus']
MAVALPPTHRPRDNLYVLFLLSYIPIIIFFDSLQFYPAGLAPGSLLQLHEWYTKHFNDQLVISQPAWFRLFTLTEPLYQLPVAVWAVWALRSKSYNAPANLLLWATVCCGTTITCVFEFYHNQLMSNQEKLVLIAMYGSYALIFGGIGVDMFCRIQKVLKAAAAPAEQKTALVS